MPDQRVWKYVIPIETDTFTLAMPAAARLLGVQVQHGAPCLWALVSPQATSERRQFRLVGTGSPVDGDLAYAGTFQLYSGTLVLHLFEVSGVGEHE